MTDEQRSLLNQRTVQESDVIHMADASSMAPRSPRRITAKCMVHARRYFFEAEPAFPEHCERVLEDIATIYRNDDETRDMTPDARLAYHQQHSRPVMDALYEWIEKQFRERVHDEWESSAFAPLRSFRRGPKELRVDPLPHHDLLAARHAKTTFGRRDHTMGELLAAAVRDLGAVGFVS